LRKSIYEIILGAAYILMIFSHRAMKTKTVTMLVALLGAFAATGAVVGATPQLAFAQSSSSAASATDFGASSAGAGANFGGGASGAAASSGDESDSAGGDDASCFFIFADDGACTLSFRNR
jgi:hypothetical protein